jgi:uncharacterized membrane protein
MVWEGLSIGLVVGYVSTFFYEKIYKFVDKKIKKDPMVWFKGYHFHHSLYGIVLITLFVIFTNFILLGSALGNVLRHTQDEKRLTFIDKS